MVDSVLEWAPLLWTLRVVALILLVGGGWCAFLYFLRFVRPKHVRAMWNARLPRLRGVGGKLAGNEFAVDLGQDEQVDAVEDRLTKLESEQMATEQVVEDVVRFLLREEAQYELNIDPPPDGIP
jgi:hypothetical protein